jgi:hypothetical protein
MTPITHTLLPAVLASPLLLRFRPRHYYSAAGIVALSGLLPDILTPHLSLAARFASWSHSIFAYAAFTILLLVLTLIMPKRFPLGLAVLASLAYLSHLFLDGIAGGVPALYPLSRKVFGMRLMHFHSWLYFDVAFLFLAFVVLRWAGCTNARIRKS